MAEDDYVYTKPEEPLTKTKKSYKKLIIVPIIIIILVIAYLLYNNTSIFKSGAVQAFVPSIQTNESSTTSENTTTNTTTEGYQPSELNLTIDVPKTTVSTGESFSGGYIVENNGKKLKLFIVMICRREGYEKEFLGIAKSTLPGDTEWTRSFSMVLEPCKIDENGFGGSTETFMYPGTYVYEIKVYNCSQLENAFGVICENINYDSIETNFSPISSVEKTITVTGEATTGCKSSDDCSQTCEGCTSGKYLCEQTNNKCIECFMDSQCKKGYFCNDSTQKCDKSSSSCKDLGGVVCDPSTHGGSCCCTDNIITGASDTTCCCTPSSQYSYGACCGIP